MTEEQILLLLISGVLLYKGWQVVKEINRQMNEGFDND
jgi:hypothetical protein